VIAVDEKGSSEVWLGNNGEDLGNVKLKEVGEL
jgi:hypothetical protein